MYSEVEDLLRTAGFEAADMKIVDVHSNGQIYLTVDVSRPITRKDSEAILRAVGRVRKYVVQLRLLPEPSSQPVVTTTGSIGGSRLVASPSAVDDPPEQ